MADRRQRGQRRFEPYQRHNKKYDIVNRIKSQKGVRSQLILFHSELDAPYTILHNAVDRIQGILNVLNLDSDKKSSHRTCHFQLIVDKEVLAEGQYSSVVEAKRCLAELALINLKKSCFTIFRKIHPRESPKVDLNTASTSTNKTQISDSSVNSSKGIGAKMMKQMGWSGGGLGVNEQGQTEFVRPYIQIERQGLGSKNIVKEIRDVLERYASSRDINSIAFSSDFTKDERVIIHKVARQLNLKSKSYGQSEERILVIQSKIRPWDIIYSLIDAGGETDQLKLIYPTDL